MRSETSATAAIRWVSTDWLLEHHQDKELIIVDAQPDVHDYIKAHVPGAFYLPEKLFRSYWQSLPAEWIPPQAAEAILRRLGVEPDKPVVVYTGVGLVKGWGDGLEQTMVGYSLVRFGLSNVLILDGGLNKWLKDGKPTSQLFPSAVESRFKATVRSDLFVTYDEFKQIKDNADVLVLDARPPNVYAGEGPWIRNGHIPGSVNLPWKSLMDAENPALLKPRAEIERLVAERGATRDKTIVCSCGTGREATNEFLLFKYFLGYPRVRIFEGAFTQWSSHPDNPVVTGPSPR